MEPRIPPRTVALMTDRGGRLRFVTVGRFESLVLTDVNKRIITTAKSYGVTDPFLIRVTPFYWNLTK
jgi:hypothetical protein